MSNFFQKCTLVLIGLIALLILGIRFCSHTEKGGMVLARFQLNLPILGDVVRMSGASQFAHTMSTLLSAGMPILHAIEAAGRTVDNKVMATEITGSMESTLQVLAEYYDNETEVRTK